MIIDVAELREPQLTRALRAHGTAVWSSIISKLWVNVMLIPEVDGARREDHDHVAHAVYGTN
jgi:hypothetical protein